MYTTIREAEFNVVVPHAAWAGVFRPISKDPRLIATGLLRRDPRRVPTGLLADELTASVTPPVGASFAQQADWIAVAMPLGEPPADPGAWIGRLQPRFAQLLAVLLVGFGPDRADWRGWTIERGVIRPLAGLQIVGPEMVSAVLNPGSGAQMLKSGESRWTRTVDAIGKSAFSKLRQASVCVIGCSRSGNLAAGMLAALGVRTLGLIDGDTIELHNLDGMVLATEDDVGENKAVALARRLAAFRSDMAVHASRRAFGARYDEPAIGNADLIVTCVDRDAPRLRAAQLARQRLIPHLDIGTGVARTPREGRIIAADVRLLLPGCGCVRCVGGLRDLEQAEFELWAPPGALPRRAPERWDARDRLGSLMTVNSVAVATGVQSWLDLLAGELPGSIWHRLRWRPGKGWQIDSGLVTAAPTCPVCQRDQAA